MAMSKTANLVLVLVLVLVPAPGMGHLRASQATWCPVIPVSPSPSSSSSFPYPDNTFDSHLLSLQSDPSLLNNGVNFLIMPLLDALHLDHTSVGLSPPVDDNGEGEIMRWLDTQPPRSGCFDEIQVEEIAAGLERSGRRLLWSLRWQPGNHGVLPEGKGKVIGWAPQKRVLAHGAVGGFVSHFGWNSILESIWFSVPIAAWPLYAEQQLNAFMLLREMGLATEVKMDYRQNHKMFVEAGKVKEAIKKVEKVIEMSDKARKAVEEGGSSYESFGRFIDTIFSNLP